MSTTQEILELIAFVNLSIIIQNRWILFEICLQLGMMSAMSLAGLGSGGGSGDDDKAKEEKKRTEAERQKNGKKHKFTFFELLKSYEHCLT